MQPADSHPPLRLGGLGVGRGTQLPLLQQLSDPPSSVVKKAPVLPPTHLPPRWAPTSGRWTRTRAGGHVTCQQHKQPVRAMRPARKVKRWCQACWRRPHTGRKEDLTSEACPGQHVQPPPPDHHLQQAGRRTACPAPGRPLRLRSPAARRLELQRVLVL